MNHENTSAGSIESMSYVEKRGRMLLHSVIAAITIAVPNILLLILYSDFMFFAALNLFVVSVPVSFVFACIGLKYEGALSKDEKAQDSTIKKIIIMDWLIILADVIFIGLIICIIAFGKAEGLVYFFVFWYGLFN